MSGDQIKRHMVDNATILRHLQRRVDETFRERASGPDHMRAWIAACRDFHERYDSLAFPGGYDAALAALEANDPGTIDVALCFVESRPYFFRSGYMYTRLMRRLRKCRLTTAQAERYAAVVARASEWRRKKAATRDQK